MDFDFVPENKLSPAKGKVLLAEPFLDDPYFKRTVVLICEHNDEGTFGFVLNNYIDFELDKIIDGMPGVPTKVSIGGPVKSNNLYYIHTLGDSLPDSIQITEGVYMGGDFEQLKNKMKSGEIGLDQVRFFVGYSGWSPKQLDSELDQRSWFVTSVSQEVIMRTDITDLWKKIMRTMGKRFEIIANLPDDPSKN